MAIAHALVDVQRKAANLASGSCKQRTSLARCLSTRHVNVNVDVSIVFFFVLAGATPSN